MKASYSKLMSAYAFRAIERQHQKYAPQTGSNMEFGRLIAIAVYSVVFATIGTLGYLFVFWIALKCGIQL